MSNDWFNYAWFIYMLLTMMACCNGVRSWMYVFVCA